MPAQYPAAVYTPRTMVNRTGAVYDAVKTKVIYAEDFNKDRAEIVAVETELGTDPAGAYDTVKAWLTALANAVGGIVTTFLGLTDTPASYAGSGGKVVAVKSDASGLEFVAPGGGGGGATIVVKPSNETVTSSTILQNDDHLKIAIGASEKWIIEALLFVNTGASSTPDIKVAFTVPTDATMKFEIDFIDQYDAPNFMYAGLLTASGVSAGVLSVRLNLLAVVRIKGSVINGANAGDVQLQWAQRVSDGTGTVVESCSYIRGDKQA